MPALKATITGDESGLKNSLDRSLAQAEGWSKKFESTVNNKSRAQSAGDSYAQWWGEAMLKRDVDMASRRNRARALLRQREARRKPPEPGHGGNSGAMREGMVLIREIARGDWNRALSSGSILLGQLRLIPLLLNPVTGIIVGIGAAVFAVARYISQTAESLASLKPPDGVLTYIAKSKQAINAAAEAQKEINREVEKSVDLYESAASAAGRIAEETKDHFDHLRKMAEYQESADLKSAKTDSEKLAILEKYAAQKLAINADERAAQIKNKEAEQAALEAESARKKAEGDAIHASSTDQEAQDVANKKLTLDEFKRQFAEQQEKGQRAPEGPLGDEQRAAEKAKRDQIADAETAYKGAVDRQAENVQRRKDELYKGAAESASKAVVAGLEVKEMRKRNSTRTQEENEESEAKLAADGTAGGKKNILRGHLTALQQQGAFAGPASVAVLDVNRKQLHVLIKIQNSLERGARGGGGVLNLGKVKF